MIIDADFPSAAPGLYGLDYTKMLDGRWAQVGALAFGNDGSTTLVDDPDPTITGSVLKFRADAYGGAGNYVLARKAIPAGATVKVGQGARFYLPYLPPAADQIPMLCRWKDGGNNLIAQVTVTTTGALQAYNNGALIGTTAGPVITANGWWHVEAQLTCDAAAGGSLTVWVEGLQVLNITGLTTNVASTSQIEMGVDPAATSANPPMYVKDWVLWDGTGAVNNTQIGPVIVCDLTENGDVSGGWTSTGANKWSVINESPPDDTGYIDAVTPPPADQICTLTDLPANIVGVRGLVTVVRAWKTDGGDGSLTVGVTPDAGAHYADGASHAVSSAPTYFTDASNVSPATGVAYTPVEVNASNIRFKRTA